MNKPEFVKPLKNPVLPDADGFFGEYGGQFVPEILRPNLDELTDAFMGIVGDESFWQAFQQELFEFSGRPTPVTYARQLSEVVGGAKIFLKREDLNQTGAHKINNVIGQGLLMQRLGKTRAIAETGAGQHGVATATMAARLGFDACVYMGDIDVNRQRPNVFWMERLGAKVVPVTSGTKTLKDAVNEALRDWSGSVETTHYVLGSAVGPHPYPAMVSYFQSVIGLEAREQMLTLYNTLPDKVFACVGGGSNAMGIFQGFLDDDTELVGVEAGGKGDQLGEHSSRIASGQGSVGIAEGFKTIFLQTDEGQMIETHSIAAGINFIGTSPILADWSDKGKMRMEKALDAEAVDAVRLLIQHEGIIPALESAHGLAGAIKDAKTMSQDQSVLVNLSGRGDKDIFTMAQVFEDKSWAEYLQNQVEVLKGS